MPHFRCLPGFWLHLCHYSVKIMKKEKLEKKQKIRTKNVFWVCRAPTFKNTSGRLLLYRNVDECYDYNLRVWHAVIVVNAKR